MAWLDPLLEPRQTSKFWLGLWFHLGENLLLNSLTLLAKFSSLLLLDRGLLAGCQPRMSSAPRSCPRFIATWASPIWPLNCSKRGRGKVWRGGRGWGERQRGRERTKELEGNRAGRTSQGPQTGSFSQVSAQEEFRGFNTYYPMCVSLQIKIQ